MTAEAPDITLVIPMAGSGLRFREAGYALPKPLIDVEGRPMIAHVIENIRLERAKLILIAQRADAKAHAAAFERLAAQYKAETILIDGLTQGAACTVLHAAGHIDNDRPLLLANSDQWIDFSVREFVRDAQDRGLDGSILTFEEPSRDPKWSYARTGENGLVLETKEKSAISAHATVGIYWFAHGRRFIEAAEEMIARDDRCNNEFYVCPVYNYLIRKGLKIGVHAIDKKRMHGLGTPGDLQAFLARRALP